MGWRRKQSLVNSHGQSWFALELIVITIGFSMIGFFLLFVPPMSEIIGEPEVAEEMLSLLLPFILLRWPLVILAWAILFIIGILMSHRLYGPLMGLSRTLERWMKGDRSARVYFRKYDYLLPAKKELNTFFEKHEKLLDESLALAKEIKDRATEGKNIEAAEKAAKLMKLLEGEKKNDV